MPDRLPFGIREAVYLRDGNACVLCGRHVENIHHRKPAQRLDGDHTAWNLLSLCGSGTTGCHGWIEAHRAYATDLGWLVPQEADVDPLGAIWRPSWGSWACLYDDGLVWGSVGSWIPFSRYAEAVEDAWEAVCPDRIDGHFAGIVRELCRALWRKGTPPSLIAENFARFCAEMLPRSMPPSLAARWSFAAGWADSEWHSISERWRG